MGAVGQAAEVPYQKAPKCPPGYIWEIFVLYVIEQRVKKLRAEGGAEFARYNTGGVRELTLFMDVLLAASELLRPALPGQTQPVAIALSYLCSAEE